VIRVYLKVYRVDNEVLVAVCDEKYIGKEFSEGDLQLKVTEKFYGREPATCLEVTEALRDATIANLVGEESIACAIGAGVIDSSHVIFVDNVPHAQMICMM
jgi:hypothetical protein